MPVSTLAGLADPLVAVHGQSDQHRLLRPAAQRDALDSFAGAAALKLRDRFGQGYAALRATETELADVVESARERAREADLLRFGLGEVEEVDPQPGEDAALASEESRLGFADTLRTAAEQARECLSAEDGGPDALGAVSAARKLLDGVREHDPEAAGLADRLAEISYLLSDAAADVASYAIGAGDRPGPAGRRLRAPGRAGRADPEVRRHHRRRARLVRARRRPAARAGQHRRADRRADRASATGSARSSPRSADRAHRGPDQGGRAARHRGDRRARLAGDAARDADHRGHPDRRRARAAGGGPDAAVRAHRRRRRRAAAGRQPGRRAATARQGRLGR